MSDVAELAFLGCLGVVLYIYFGYPLLLVVLARLHPRPVRGGPCQPSVSVIIPAHNEERAIGEKLANTLALDYPVGLLEVLVASDGSTDATGEIARAAGVRLLDLERQGKAFALNSAAAVARGEVLVFTDANTLLEPDALRWLVESYADPEVGGVCGNKKYRARGGSDATARGEGLYWRWDKWQKQLETRIGSAYASDGALHSLRRELYVPIADPAQADDIALSTRVVLQGYRLVFEPRAVVWEEEPEEGLAEFRRKVRVTNHSVRALLQLGPALWTSGFYSLELLSHKLVRHLAAFFLLGLLGASLFLVPRPFYSLALAAQGLFYLAALAGFALRRRSIGRRKLLWIPYYFSLVNLAALLGVIDILRGQRLRAWTPRGGAG